MQTTADTLRFRAQSEQDFALAVVNIGRQAQAQACARRVLAFCGGQKGRLAVEARGINTPSRAHCEAVGKLARANVESLDIELDALRSVDPTLSNRANRWLALRLVVTRAAWTELETVLKARMRWQPFSFTHL